MTSRNSFFNLLKEDLHRRLWTLILSSLVAFGTFVVAFTMVIQNHADRYARMSDAYTEIEKLERISNGICQNFYGAFWWYMIVALVGSVICAMNGFAYLHSKKQVDFYHSLPVKREKIFAVRLVNGILIYALPYFVGLLYTYLLCILYGLMTVDILWCSLFFFVVHLMGYIILYLANIAAMMLTGKLVIAFFGICAINLYAPAMFGLIELLKDTFFVTAVYASVDMEDAFHATRWLSPASYYYSLCAVVEQKTAPGLWPEVLSFLLLTAVLIGLNLWLYKKRASEKADTAMSFQVTEPVIRFMIAIPMGIVIGMLFAEIQAGNDNYIFWLIFGALLGSFLAHGIIESLYKGDIRKCLSHKVQMLIAMVAAVAVPLIFIYDVFGYDSYLPKKKEIANMALVSSAMQFHGTYYEENGDGWMSNQRYAQKYMEVTEFDAIYELVTLLAEDIGEKREDRVLGRYGNRSTTSYYSNIEKEFVTEFTVRYTLKNGSEVLRAYTYDMYKVLDLLEQIYNNEEYKVAVHPIYSLMKAGYEPERIECYAPVNGVSVELKKNVRTILDTYAEEMLAIPFKELETTAAVGEMNVHFTIPVEGGAEYADNTTMLVYPSMTRTIALLKEQGYSMYGVQDAENIQNITLYYSGSTNDLKKLLGLEVSDESKQEYYLKMDENSYTSSSFGDGVSAWETEMIPVPVETVEYKDNYHEIVLEFTDPAEIAAIKKSLVYRDYASEIGPFPETVQYLNPEVYFELGSGIAYENGIVGWSERFRFLEGQVPQVVYDRLYEELMAQIVLGTTN